MYIKNFGEFFNNQIEHAGTIVLSRTQDISEEKLAKAIELIREHNANATIITTPWDELDGKAILDTFEGAKDLEKELMEQVEHEHHHHHDHDEDCCCGHDHEHEHEHHHHDNDEDCCCGHDHEHEHEHHHHDHDEECGCGHDHEHEHHHHDHDAECGCGHDHEHEHHHHDHGEGCTCGCHDHDGHHHADEVFTSWGKETAKKFTVQEIEAALDALEDDKTYGMILRAKGMVPSADGTWIYFDYVPGEKNVREGKADVTGKLCVIGSNLDEHNLEELFL